MISNFIKAIIVIAVVICIIVVVSIVVAAILLTKGAKYAANKAEGAIKDYKNAGICKYCGAVNDRHAKKCKECGAPLKKIKKD